MVVDEPDVPEDEQQEEEQQEEEDPEPVALAEEKKPELEQQLSKKELKKREMEELDAVLAELVLQKEDNGDAPGELRLQVYVIVSCQTITARTAASFSNI